MNKKLVEILACPIDKHHPLEMFQCTIKEEVILDGALFCQKCTRFYPIIDEIPIMLPDELRDKKQDLEFLEKFHEKLPEKITKNGLPWHI